MKTSPCPICGAAIKAGGVCAACALGDALGDEVMLEPGTLGVIAGHELIEVIARGGMGVVYRARQQDPAREVALKALPGAELLSEEARQRFRIEAQAMARLEHPAIVPVYEIGEEDSTPFFTMKLAKGGTLAQRIGDYAGKWREIAELIATLAEAVQFAHSRGVLHRDLKPGNILFDEGSTMYVSDFGLAKLLGTETDLTRTLAMMGTPSYLAPELVNGGKNDVSAASDVWSIGVMLYELLAGRRPFEGESVQAILRAISDAEPAPLRDVPRDLAVITMKALAKDPSRRYASALELADDLRRWLESRPILARGTTQTERLRLWVRRNPSLAAVSAVAVLALSTAVALLVWGLERARQETQNVAAARDQMSIAQNESQQQLRDALLARANSGRIAGLTGWRGSGLKALQQAAAIQNGVDLRSEAIAHLAGTDLVLTGKWLQNDRSTHIPGASPLFDLFATYVRDRVMFWDATGAQSGPAVMIENLSAVDAVVSATFDPSGQWLILDRSGVNGSVLGEVTLIDVKTRRVLRQWAGVGFSGFSHNGGWFALLFDGGRVGIFQAADGSEAGAVVIPAPAQSINLCRLQPSEDSSLVACVIGNLLEIWNWKEQRRVHQRQLSYVVGRLAWSDDFIAVTAASGGFAGEVLNVRNLTSRGFAISGIFATRLSFVPGIPLLCVLGSSGYTTVLDPITGEEMLPPSPLFPRAYDRTGRRFVNWSAARQEICFGEVEMSEAITTLDVSTFGTGWGMDISPDGRWLLLYQRPSSAVGAVTLWDLKTKCLTSSILPAPGFEPLFLSDSFHFVCHELKFPASLPVESRWWLCGLEVVDRRIELRRQRAITSDFSSRYQWRAISPDRQWGALFGERALAILDPLAADPNQQFQTLDPQLPGGYSGISNDVCHWSHAKSTIKYGRDKSLTEIKGAFPAQSVFSPDGRWAFAKSSNGFQVYDASCGRTQQEFAADIRLSTNHSEAMAAWSPDSRFLIWAHDRSVVSMVDTSTWTVVAELNGPRQDTIRALQFTPDGRTIVILRDAGLVEFWDLTKLSQELAALGMPWDLPPPSKLAPPGITGPVKPLELPPAFSPQKPASR